MILKKENEILKRHTSLQKQSLYLRLSYPKPLLRFYSAENSKAILEAGVCFLAISAERQKPFSLGVCNTNS